MSLGYQYTFNTNAIVAAASTGATVTSAPSLPALTALASMVMQPSATSAVSLPSLVASADALLQPAISASPSLPVLTASASLSHSQSASSVVTLPALVVSSIVIQSDMAILSAVSLPALTASASLSGSNVTIAASPSLPKLTASAALLGPALVTASPSLPKLTASSSLIQQPDISSVVSLPKVTTNSVLGTTTAVTITSAPSLPALVERSNVWQDNYAAVTLPALQAIAELAYSTYGDSINLVTQTIEVSHQGLLLSYPSVLALGTSPIIEVVSPGVRTIQGVGRLYRPRRSHGIFIHDGWWPFRRLAELVTAHDRDRSYTLMDVGEAAIQVSRYDPAISRDIFRHGNFLVIDYSDQPTWAGPIIGIAESIRSGTVAVRAIGAAAIIDGRVAPQRESYEDSIGSGQIVRTLLERANARAHTGIMVGDVHSGPSVQDLDIGGQSVLEALEELHQRTDYEWHVRCYATPGHLEFYLDWLPSVGADLSGSVILTDGIHFNDIDRTQDLTDSVQAVQVIGEFGRELANRASAIQQVESFGRRREIGASALGLSDEAVWAVSDLPPGMRNERIIHEVMTGNVDELVRRANVGLERPLRSQEEFSATVNRNIDWANIQVGNYVLVNASFGTGNILRKVRIKSTQPDEESGEIEVVFEVPAR